MKKLVLGVILAGMVLVPFAAMADTGGSASATLTLEAVINTIVTDNWDNLTITQNELVDSILAIANGGTVPIEWGAGPEITVVVQAMTDWKVWATYYAPAADLALIDLEDSFLYLNSVALLFDDAGIDVLTYAGPYLGTLTDVSFSGSNNLPAGTSKDFEVQWDPSQIDANANDALDLTVKFVVEDTSI